MELPKINPKIQKSKKIQNILDCEISKLIESIEIANDYVFEPYEIDNVLLGIIKNNHENYLKAKFGNLIGE